MSARTCQENIKKAISNINDNVTECDINDDMKIAAAYALAGLIGDEELNAEYVIPAPFDPRVGRAVAKAVAEAARKSGIAMI